MEHEETPRERSERFLAHLGLETRPPPDIGAVCRLLEHVTTRTGGSRRARLESCGVAFPVLDVEGRLAWERRGCRDRFCPECAASLSRERAAMVREWWATREAAGARGLFITLTQPKRPNERPKAARDRLLATWRQIGAARIGLADGLLRSRSKRVGPPILPGGLRSLELTARPAGARVGDYVVKVGGVHAHLHILAEMAPGVTPRTVAARLITAWTSIAGASPGAQDVQPITATNIYQAAKYAADFGALAELIDIAPGYARAVVDGMTGARIVDPWGTWRGCLRRRPGGVHFGDRSIAAIVMQCEGRVSFGARSMAAEDVLAGLADRWGDIRAAERAMARELEREAASVDAARAASRGRPARR